MNETTQFIKNYTDQLLLHLNVKPDYEINETGTGVALKITGNDLNFLIGYRGDSLEGFQHMLNMALFAKFGEWKDVMVDINGYRDARKEKIEEMTRNFIDKVRFFTKEIEMPAMSSFERKQVHEFVAQCDDVTSESAGDGFTRHVIIYPAK